MPRADVEAKIEVYNYLNRQRELTPEESKRLAGIVTYLKRYDYLQGWNAANPDKLKAASRKYDKSAKGRVTNNKKHRTFYANNREAAKARTKAYRVKNKEMVDLKDFIRKKRPRLDRLSVRLNEAFDKIQPNQTLNVS